MKLYFEASCNGFINFSPGLEMEKEMCLEKTCTQRWLKWQAIVTFMFYCMEKWDCSFEVDTPKKVGMEEEKLFSSHSTLSREKEKMRDIRWIVLFYFISFWTILKRLNYCGPLIILECSIRFYFRNL